MSVTSSLLIGALLGAANAAVALVVARRAVTLGLASSLNLVVGGMAVRLVLLLGAVAAVLVLVPVHRLAFVGGLGAVFVAGLVAEVVFVLGRADRGVPAPRPPADA